MSILCSTKKGKTVVMLNGSNHAHQETSSEIINDDNKNDDIVIQALHELTDHVRTLKQIISKDVENDSDDNDKLVIQEMRKLTERVRILEQIVVSKDLEDESSRAHQDTSIVGETSNDGNDKLVIQALLIQLMARVRILKQIITDASGDDDQADKSADVCHDGDDDLLNEVEHINDDDDDDNGNGDGAILFQGEDHVDDHDDDNEPLLLNEPARTAKEPPLKDWDLMYQELAEFYKNNRNLRVGYPSRLHNWMSTQRGRYRGRKGRLLPLTKEQIQLLDKIKFDWNPKRGGAHPRNKEWKQKMWTTKYQKLAKFYKKNGHFRVEDKSLYHWINNQRRRRSARSRGRLAPLTPKQIQLLNKINFPWNPKVAPRGGGLK